MLITELFLTDVLRAAIAVGHPFPDITAAEAAYDSNFGGSAPATRANNVFHMQPEPGFSFESYSRVKLFSPATDQKTRRPTLVTNYYVLFPSIEACVAARLAYLRWRSLADAPIAEALRIAEQGQTAENADSYVRALAKSLPGDNRADVVLTIQDGYRHVLAVN